MGLSVSDQLVAASIMNNPAFKGADGQFNRALFDQALRNVGLSEAGFVQEQRAAMARLHLAEAIAGDINVPVAAKEAMHRYASERRAASYRPAQPGCGRRDPRRHARTASELLQRAPERRSARRNTGPSTSWPSMRPRLPSLTPCPMRMPASATSSRRPGTARPSAARSSRSPSRRRPRPRLRPPRSRKARPSRRLPPSATSLPRTWISAPSPRRRCSTRPWPTRPSLSSRARRARRSPAGSGRCWCA